MMPGTLDRVVTSVAAQSPMMLFESVDTVRTAAIEASCRPA
jgi:hypothetical protein